MGQMGNKSAVQSMMVTPERMAQVTSSFIACQP